MRTEISRQAQEQEDEVRRLRDAVRGRTDEDSSEDDASDEEDDDETTVAGIVAKARKQVEQVLTAPEKDETGEEASGLFGMAFMKRGAERKRKQAEVEANDLLDELKLLEEPSDAEVDAVETSHKDEFTDEQLVAASNDVAHLLSTANPWISAAAEVAPASASAAGPRAKRRRKEPQTEAAMALPKTILEESEILKNFQDDVDEEQRELIRTLFVQSEEPRASTEGGKTGEAVTPTVQSLPGWGRWVGSGTTKRSRRGGKAHKQQQEEKLANSTVHARTSSGDKKVSRVKVMNAGATPAVNNLPHNFKDADEYRKLRAMDTTAPELLSAAAHARAVAPRVNIRLGAVVPPLESGKQLSVGERDILLDAWNNKRRPSRTKAKF
jgi:U3 small nucleolar RNA-associated protein 14